MLMTPLETWGLIIALIGLAWTIRLAITEIC